MPAVLKDAPALPADLAIPWEAFWALAAPSGTTRPVPFAEIAAWCDLHGIGGPTRRRMPGLIRAMEAVLDATDDADTDRSDGRV